MATNYALLRALLDPAGVPGESSEADGDQGKMSVVLGGEPAENNAYVPELKVTREPTSYSGADLMAPDYDEYATKRAAMGEQNFGQHASDFDTLGAAAGFTGSPVLAQMWQHRAGQQDRDRQFALQMLKEKRQQRDDDLDYENKKAKSPYEIGKLKRDSENGDIDLGEKRAAIDPSSPYSKAMRSGLATQLQAFGSTLAQRGAQSEAETYLNAANMIEKNQQLSVSQMLNAVEPLTAAAKFNLSALHDQATEANAAASLGNDRSRIGAEFTRIADTRAERELNREIMLDNKEKARQQHADDRQDKQAQLMPPGSQSNEYLDRIEAEKKIVRAKELVSSGKIRYIGKGAKTLNSVLSTAPDALDIRNPEEKEFASLLAWIAAPERKELFGSSLTGGEQSASDELFANVGKNKGSVMQSLDHMGSAARTKNEQVRKLYPGLGKIDAPSAPIKKQAPANKSTLSGKDQAALDWANSHADDPRAKAIKQHLGAQ